MKPEGIVLHHGVGGYSSLINTCMNAKAKVSYHCIVNTTGERTVLVPDNVRAWHAGVSSFKGKANCNNFLLGIAVSGNTNERELTDQETESVAEWCVRKMKSYSFGLDAITTHRAIAPNRKNDIDTRAEKKIKDKILELLK
jgi:AmpD protein